jgi:predicted aspartyl protease
MISSGRREVVALRDTDAGYVVDVMVNGTGPYPFMLDTVATMLFLSDDVANKLKLPAEPVREGPTAFGQKVPGCSIVRVSSVPLGKTEFGDRPACVLPGNTASADS